MRWGRGTLNDRNPGLSGTSITIAHAAAPISAGHIPGRSAEPGIRRAIGPAASTRGVALRRKTTRSQGLGLIPTAAIAASVGITGGRVAHRPAPSRFAECDGRQFHSTEAQKRDDSVRESALVM